MRPNPDSCRFVTPRDSWRKGSHEVAKPVITVAYSHLFVRTYQLLDSLGSERALQHCDVLGKFQPFPAEVDGYRGRPCFVITADEMGVPVHIIPRRTARGETLVIPKWTRRLRMGYTA